MSSTWSCDRNEGAYPKREGLGSGGRNCEVTAKAIAQAAKEAGVEIELEKVTDLARIMSFGILSTPGVVIDGKVVHGGGIPGPDQIRGWVRG